MGFSVDLDPKLGLRAIEVEHKMTYRMLATGFQTSSPST
ncbi:hypothetical protein BMF35_a0902 [Aurantiacibacter gangjinensis]|nr:hypothetical protein BMF35_a0902 [Aurantiacibacter gangjinensis]